jgi:hypothetical protein
VQDSRGIWRFDPAELEAIRPRARKGSPALGSVTRIEARDVARKGRLAARVFRMFARYATLPQIVLATRQPPDVIRELYREWSTTLDQGEWERQDDATQRRSAR